MFTRKKYKMSLYGRRVMFVNNSVGKSENMSETKCTLIIERNGKLVEKFMDCYRIPMDRHESSVRLGELYEVNGYCLTDLKQCSNHEFGKTVCL